MSYNLACPTCGKDREYAVKYTFEKAMRKNTVCYSCRTVANNIRRAGSKVGENNPAWKGYKDIAGKILSRVKNGARSRGLCFDITLKDLDTVFEKQHRCCALTGTTLQWNVDASVDRIDSSKGYTVDNIQIVHKEINMMKRDYTQEQFVRWCVAVSQFKGTI